MSQIPQTPSTKSKSKPKPRPLSLHSHRVDRTSSKLPRIRDATEIVTQIPTGAYHRSTLSPSQSADAKMATNTPNSSHGASTKAIPEQPSNNLELKSSSFDLKFTGNSSTVATPFSPTSQNKKEPFRTRILSSFAGSPKSLKPSSSRRTLSYPTPTPIKSSATTIATNTSTSTKLQQATAASDNPARTSPPVSNSNGKDGLTPEVARETKSTMLSPGSSSYVSQTTNWVADQSHLDQNTSPPTSYAPQSSTENTQSRPVVLPAGGVRNNKRMDPGATERESALRSLEGRNGRRESPHERTSEEDLFLQVAQEEDDIIRQRNLPALNGSDSKKVIHEFLSSSPRTTISTSIGVFTRSGIEISNSFY